MNKHFVDAVRSDFMNRYAVVFYIITIIDIFTMNLWGTLGVSFRELEAKHESRGITDMMNI